MDKKVKKYEVAEDDLVIAAEPMVLYGCAIQTVSSSERCDTRNDVKRAITGEMLLSRLRPRIKSLFE